MNTTTTIPADADYKEKPWVARILGRDRTKTYQREFVPPTVTQPGLYEATARKGRRNMYLVVRDEQEGLVRLSIGDETLALVLDVVGVGSIGKIAPFKTEDGAWAVRRDGAIQLRAERDALVAERARLTARLAELDALLA